MLGFFDGLGHNAGSQQFGQYVYRAVRTIDQIERDTGSAETRKDFGNGGVMVGPISDEQNEVVLGKGGLNFVTVQGGDLVGLTGDAPSCREVHKNRSTFSQGGFDGLVTPGLPMALAGNGTVTIEHAGSDHADDAGRHTGRYRHQQTVSASAPLLSAKKPKEDGSGAAGRQHQQHAVQVDLFGKNPAKPDYSESHGDGHDFSKDVHPGSGTG